MRSDLNYCVNASFLYRAWRPWCSDLTVGCLPSEKSGLLFSLSYFPTDCPFLPSCFLPPSFPRALSLSTSSQSASLAWKMPEEPLKSQTWWGSSPRPFDWADSGDREVFGGYSNVPFLICLPRVGSRWPSVKLRKFKTKSGELTFESDVILDSLCWLYPWWQTLAADSSLGSSWFWRSRVGPT